MAKEYTAESIKALEIAATYALEKESAYTGSEHILMGLFGLFYGTFFLLKLNLLEILGLFLFFFLVSENTKNSHLKLP